MLNIHIHSVVCGQKAVRGKGPFQFLLEGAVGMYEMVRYKNSNHTGNHLPDNSAMYHQINIKAQMVGDGFVWG